MRFILRLNSGEEINVGFKNKEGLFRFLDTPGAFYSPEASLRIRIPISKRNVEEIVKVT